ncbi:MAG: hypothetical protein GEU93_05490 [Propionibacteriales bacterium]|nr:hypothetical protein [Propionibacteriales bacterium]
MSGYLIRAHFSRLLVFAVGLLLLAAQQPGSIATMAELPLGKQRFAVAVGGLSADSTTNWVRLGLYDFTDDGTVTERHWYWTQRGRTGGSYTEFVTTRCPPRECRVQTAAGYQSTGGSQTLEGTYVVDGHTLRITWEDDVALEEEWTLTKRAGSRLAALELVASDDGATHGFGYGSNAAWDARIPAAEIADFDHSRLVHRYHIWRTTPDRPDPHLDEGDGRRFRIQEWTVCDGGRCLGAESNTPTEYFISPADDPTEHRRDTLWHWPRGPADGRGEYRYIGKSHVKPMVQIVDDDGGFHGWVGVEASLNQTAPDQGAYGELGIFQIAG